jgi:hypothetical protein
VKRLAMVLLCGWVMWQRTVSLSGDRRKGETWDPKGSYDSLARCTVGAQATAAARASDFSKQSVRYKEGDIGFTITRGGFEQTIYYDCYPGTIDPRPRSKE